MDNDFFSESAIAARVSKMEHEKTVLAVASDAYADGRDRS